MSDPTPTLLAVPNVSEGRDADRIASLARAFAPARLLDTHSDPDHGRSVFTLAASQGELVTALLNGARAAAQEIDLTRHTGAHPHVGALDVAPVVYLDDATRGAAIAEALTAAARIGDELRLPVFLYGQLATTEANVERAALRAGGTNGLAARGLTPDYGPATLDPRSGAVLVTARPPLIAFNVDLAAGDVELAKQIAAGLRESNGGFEGVRAIGLSVRGRAQVSMNVHDYAKAPLQDLVEAIRTSAPIAEAELVGLAPRAALDGFPPDVALRGFDPAKHLIENALRSSG